ncbi:uncharacterized protein LOC119769868 [Culex quinquefasciatus]|uniref:uncharacterized protein LOC119769868 n=1 Tax=Culex quinquefasciatus TaxID=7176 RepID=UPI0018E2A35E|nr:uncharacterized protein LOC119769868 [Culex quinquefasciatus]
MQISTLVLLVATLFVISSHQTPDGGCGCGSRNVQEVARVKREEPELRPANCNCARCDAGKPCGCGCGNGGGKIFEVLVQGRVKRQEEETTNTNPVEDARARGKAISFLRGLETGTPDPEGKEDLVEKTEVKPRLTTRV